MSLPRYAEYKASGTDWLGEVPNHWVICALAYRYDVALGKMLDEKRVSGAHLAPYLRNVDVQWGRINTEALPQMDFSGADVNRYGLRAGDLLVCEGGEIGRAAIWEGQLAECYYQKALHRLRPRSGEDTPRFFQYVLRSAVAHGAFAGIGGKATIAHLPAESFRRVVFPFPPAQEQLAIASFLDRETSKIDALIAEQETLLALLAEKRQATISHAVTRGLDPHAPMKDSGIAWLGEVPAHWEMRRLKTLSPMITVGIVVNPSEYVSPTGLPFIYGGDITEGHISSATSRRIDPADSDRQAKTRLQARDLLTVRVGAPGVTAVVSEECEGGNCASVMLTRRGDFDSNWLCFAMNSRMVRYQVEVVQYGAAQEQFNIGHAINFWIATPPRLEQRILACRIDETACQIEYLSAEARRAITLMQERRSALIFAAVTGQIDVRGLVDRDAA